LIPGMTDFIPLLTDACVENLNLARKGLDEAQAKEFCDMLARNTSVKSLDMSSNGLASSLGAVAAALSTNSTLTSLDLSDNAIGAAAECRVLGDALCCTRSLESINLSRNRLGEAEGSVLCKAICCNIMLSSVHVDLSQNSLRDAGCRAMAEGLTTSTSMRSLNVSENGFGAGVTGLIFEALKRNSTLNSLNISHNHMSASDYSALGATLHVNNTLTELNVSFCTLGLEGARELSRGLSNNSTLRSLDISYCNLGDGGCRAVSGSISMGRLEKLVLAHNTLGFEGASAVADEALKNNSHLTCLDLSFCNLAAQGGRAIAAALAVNSTLESLNLSANILRDEGCCAIAQALLHNNALHTLTLTSNSLGEASCRALSKALLINSSLQSLDIGSSAMPDTYLRLLCESLTSNRALVRLNLSVTFLAGHAIAETLVKGCLLQHLDLSFSSLGKNAEVDEIMHVLFTMSTLKTLNISHACLQENHMTRPLSRALAANTSIHSLDVSYNGLRGSGVALIADAIANNTTMAALNLSFNSVTACGCTSVAVALQRNRTLRSLSMSEHSVMAAWGKHAIGAVLRDFPRCVPLMIKGAQLSDVCDTLQLGHVVTKKWSDHDIVMYLHSVNRRKVLAFAMGQQARLGANSPVALLGADIVPMVFSAFFGVAEGVFRGKGELG
jgi:Ran GTPase-activating protein (RanGAP) involved in mRNA processing and transport